MKTTFIIHTYLDFSENTEEVETDLDFSVATQVAMNKVPISAFDTLYAIDRVMSIDLTENTIEVDATII